MSDRNTIGREPLTIVEIDQDQCTLVYGVEPCTAQLGVSGSDRCFNGLASCQDEDNFTLGTLTLRFCVPMEDTGLPKTTIVIPSVLDVDTVPARINVGAGDNEAGPLGERAAVTVRLRDHPYHDRLVDKYWDERTYDAMARGTFWSKWLKRNPYHQGRSLRVREGYVGQTLAQMRVRHYIIERIEGPSNGEVSIVAKDPLKLVDAARALAPEPNTGVLDADISAVAGSLTLSPGGSPDGVGDEYASSGTARLGSELVTFNRGVGEAFTLTARGIRGTTAAAHSAGDLFQECLVIAGTRVDAVISDLLTTYGGLDPDFIPTADWDAEADLWCSGYNLTTVITEPTGVGKLLAEICEQAGVYIWWDDQDQEVKFRAVRPFYAPTDAAAVEISDDANVIAGSLKIERKTDERISQVWIYYDQINPTKSVDDETNYARRRRVRDADAESDQQYNEARVKKIYARWLTSANDAITLTVANRILERFVDPPLVLKFLADAKESDQIRTGTVIEVTHRDLVDFTGAAEPELYQIISAEEIEPGHRVEYEARPYLFSTRFCFVMANGSPVYTAASSAQRETGGWIATDAVGMSNGDEPYRIV